MDFLVRFGASIRSSNLSLPEHRQLDILRLMPRNTKVLIFADMVNTFNDVVDALSRPECKAERVRIQINRVPRGHTQLSSLRSLTLQKLRVNMQYDELEDDKRAHYRLLFNKAFWLSCFSGCPGCGSA